MSKSYHNDLPISAWAEDDRPREKLINKGRQALSTAELLAILISSGTRNLSALDLAKVIFKSYDNSLDDLSKVSVSELIKINGIGEAKAIKIIAALELGRRRHTEEPKKRSQVRSSRDAYNYLYRHMADLPHEEFRILLLNRNNAIIKLELISKGGVSETIVDPKIVFNSALKVHASSIILCHNHPSGQVKPSQSDLALTKRLIKAGELLSIKVLDHLIIGGKHYYSFADEGMI